MRPLAEVMGALRYALRCKAARLAGYALLGAAAIWLGVAGAWWLPAEREHARLEQDIAARRTAIADAARAAGVADAQRKAVVAVALFEKKLGASAGQAELIRDVGRLASQRGMRVVSQSFDEGRTQGGNGALYLNLGLTGSYPSLRLLLNDFAALPVWLEVVEAHVERAGEGGGQVRAQLRLATYRASGGPSVNGRVQ
jgi:Tfp pilus assembly protein PilO